jgi:hypothetical protein
MTPIPTTTTSALIREPSERTTPATRDSPMTSVTVTPGAKIYTVIAVRRPRPFRRARRQDWRERDGKRLDHGDVQAARATRRGNLEADETGADDGDARCGHQFLPQCHGIVQSAQDEHVRA